MLLILLYFLQLLQFLFIVNVYFLNNDEQLPFKVLISINARLVLTFLVLVIRVGVLSSMLPIVIDLPLGASLQYRQVVSGELSVSLHHF